MTNNFDDFVNVIKKDPKVRIKIKDMLDRYKRLPYNYQSRIGNDSFIQNVFLEKMINRIGTTLADLEIEIKMKTSRIKYFESKTNSQIFKRVS